MIKKKTVDSLDFKFVLNSRWADVTERSEGNEGYESYRIAQNLEYQGFLYPQSSMIFSISNSGSDK